MTWAPPNPPVQNDHVYFRGIGNNFGGIRDTFRAQYENPNQAPSQFVANTV